jgi:hypothetical protein
MRTLPAVDNTLLSLFDQWNWRGGRGIEYKNEVKWPLAALTLLGGELFVFNFVRNSVTVQFLLQFIQGSEMIIG